MKSDTEYQIDFPKPPRVDYNTFLKSIPAKLHIEEAIRHAFTNENKSKLRAIQTLITSWLISKYHDLDDMWKPRRLK